MFAKAFLCLANGNGSIMNKSRNELLLLIGLWLRKCIFGSFYVGNVKPEDVKAKYEDGVLSVIVPKEDVKKLASSTAIAIE